MKNALRAFFCLAFTVFFYMFRPVPSSPGFSSKDLVFSNEKINHFSDLNGYLSQSYHYLGHGRQSIAFLSEDQKIVLKFFLNNQVYGSKSGWKGLDRRISFLHKKNIDQALKAYVKIYQEKPEIGALVALHLDKSSNLPLLNLFGRNKEKILIDPNLYSFVLQYKCTPVFEKFKELKNSEEIDFFANQLEQFILSKISQGFFDKRDHLFLDKNYGFINDLVVQLDVGDLLFSEQVKENSTEINKKIHQKIQKWKSKKISTLSVKK